MQGRDPVECLRQRRHTPRGTAEFGRKSGNRQHDFQSLVLEPFNVSVGDEFPLLARLIAQRQTRQFLHLLLFLRHDENGAVESFLERFRW